MKKLEQNIWPLPQRRELVGESVTLEPLTANHAELLWAQVSAHPNSFNYLRYGPFKTKTALIDLLKDLSSRTDQPFWAVIPRGGKPLGWISICDIYQKDSSIEVGSIWFSPSMQGTRNGREAIFLLMCECMDTLGYERLVWRCHAENIASCKAAENLGFKHEGIWRNAVLVDGWQRDVAWFSIIKKEWPLCRAALVNWLSADNFDSEGKQCRSISELR